MGHTWAWDIETEAWDKLVVACAVRDDGKTVIQRDYDDVRAWYTSLPSDDIVLAHNGGGFDFLCLLDACGDLEWSGRLAGSAIVSMRAKGGAECRDTYRVFPTSLAKWTGAKGKLGLACECGAECGGYCRIRRDASAAVFRQITDYCLQDCRALLDAWWRDLAWLTSEGLLVNGARELPRLTCGSIAWHTMLHMADEPTQSLTDMYGHGPGWSEYDGGRRAGYGGRTEVFRTAADIGHRYDVNALYPWALTHPVPDGLGMAVVGRRRATREYLGHRPGAFRARVIVPDGLPLLPHRTRAMSHTGRGRLHKGRLVWATGVVEGWWVRPELERAEAYGAQIKSIVAARIYASERPRYAPYMRHVYEARDRARASCVCTGQRRAEATRNGVHCCDGMRHGAILKWFANAPTGRLDMRPEQASLHVVRIAAGEDAPDGWRWLGGNVYVSDTRRVPQAARPICGAYLRARGRVRLLERLHRNLEGLVYCDTDSTYLRGEDAEGVHQEHLGAWAYEGAMSEWTALAPKVYRYCDEEGRAVVRCKGVPRPTWDTITQLRNGETVTRRIGVLSIRSSGGQFKAREIARTRRHGLDVAGTRAVTSDGTTVALRREADGTYGYPM